MKHGMIEIHYLVVLLVDAQSNCLIDRDIVYFSENKIFKSFMSDLVIVIYIYKTYLLVMKVRSLQL